MSILNRSKEIVKKILPKSLVGAYHFALALAAALSCGFPSRKLKVIGITGTNGKSTAAIMIAKILEIAGYKTALSSSIEFRIGNRSWKNRSRMTMPGRFALQKFLRDAAGAGCDYAVIEVSSEGIKQHRHRFIDFEIAAITSVTPEHIESHGSFDKYLAAKGELFGVCKKIHVLNADDANYGFFAKFFAQKKYVYSLDGQSIVNGNTLSARNLRISASGSSFEIGGIRFDLNLPGEFNISNAMAAICAAQSQEVGLEVCREALAKVKTVPGRMEKVVSDPFEVFVDYAVTPDSLKKAYQTLKSDVGQGRLICVLGSCGGGRDKWKRPVMGNLAKEYCDLAIITDEDPYDEDSMAIIGQIAGAECAKVEKIADRRRAIAKALKNARPGDKVIVTGKGCEESMCVAGGKKIPWSDKHVVLEELKKLKP